MHCPFCDNEQTSVLDKRLVGGENSTRRRRECEKCRKRFTTYERIESDVLVIKKDGRRERFNQQKLLAGITRACEKRPVSSEQVDKAIERIEASLRERSRAEVKSSLIGELVMRELKKLDKVAYIRFASVYRDFQDVNDFEKELKEIKSGR